MLSHDAICRYGLRPLVPFACGLVIVSSASSASSIKIIGVVTDQDSAPLASAAIECVARGRMLTRGAEPVDLGGRFSVQVNSDATHLTCTISAPGHKSKTQTAAVQNGQVELQGIKLEKLARLVTSPLVKNLTPDGKYVVVDMMVTNPSSQPVDAVGLQVNGAALLLTTCFDPRPAVIFKIDDHFPLRRLSAADFPTAVDVPPTNWSENVTAKGRIERLGCQQERLTLDISYLVRFNPGDSAKLRIALPRRLSVENEQPTAINLESWQALQVSLRLSDGTSIQASLK